MIRKIIFFVFLLQINNLFSQNLVNTGKLLQGGVDDGVKMVNAYITPLNRSIMVGMNNSNYNTLYTGDGKRFSVSLNSSLISIPTADQTFDINSLGLENISAEPGNSIAQTVFGDSTTITLYSRDSIPDTSGFPGGGTGGGLPFKSINQIDSVASFTFNSISGSDIHMMLLPYLSVSYKFDYANLSVDLLPFSSSDYTVFSAGINWQQDLTKLLSFKEKSPFKISATVGYYYYYLRSALEVRPEGVTIPYTLSGEAVGPYDNQELKMNFSSVYFGADVAYSVKHFTFWAGLGYNMGFSNIKILGIYPIYGSDPTGNASVSLTDIKDPMDESDSYSRFKGHLGIRFDLNRYYLQANYTLANYGGIGIALGVRF